MKSILVSLLMLVALSSSLGAITIDGNFDDWVNVPLVIEDPDDIADDDGDIKMVQAIAEEGTLYLRMAVYGNAAPANDQRYYYHWLIDADNNVDTGYNNGDYEDTPTGVTDPIGVEYMIQIGRRSGADDGIYAYALDETTVEENFPWAYSGDSMEAALQLSSFGLTMDDTIGFAAFQEGSSNGWEVDFIQTATLKLAGTPTAVDPSGKLATTWSSLRGR